VNKIIISIVALWMSHVGYASPSVCEDAFWAEEGMRSALHRTAQQRAESDVEDLMEREVVRPYIDVFGLQSTPKDMATLIEVYWCESGETLLHSAYFRFYTSNKNVFE
jgi:hypothetical protein